MNIGLTLYAVACFLMLAQGGTSGNVPRVVAATWFASPLLLAVLRAGFEDNQPKGLFSWRTQSWKFLFGDIAFLPFALAAATYGWQQLDTSGSKWYSSWLWLVASAVIGVVAGNIFHQLDVVNYAKEGMSLALDSPTKRAHDFVAYVVLSGGLVYLGAPVIFSSLFKPYGILILIGYALWELMGFRDSGLLCRWFSELPPLEAKSLHPKWDSVNFRIITS